MVDPGTSNATVRVRFPSIVFRHYVLAGAENLLQISLLGFNSLHSVIYSLKSNTYVSYFHINIDINII